MFNRIFACVSSAPFGFPVVPDVYKIIAVSSEEHCTVSKSFSSELLNKEKSHIASPSKVKLSKDLITHIFLHVLAFSKASLTSLAIDNSAVPSKQIIALA